MRPTCSAAVTAARTRVRRRAAGSDCRSCGGFATCTAGTCASAPAPVGAEWWPGCASRTPTGETDCRRSAGQPHAAEVLVQVEGGPGGGAVWLQLLQLECRW